MANRINPLNTFATTSPPWSLALLDANTTAIQSALNDSSLGWMNGVPNDTGTANNYAVALPYGAASGYNPGFTLTFIPTFTNTGASNINVGTLGPVPIVDVFGNALGPALLVAGKAALIQYTGTNFRLLNSSQSGGVPYYYDYDDFIHTSYYNAGPPTQYGTKLLSSWGTSFGPYTTVIPSHPGVWSIQAGATNASMLAVPAPGDSVFAAPSSGVALDLQTNLMMRSILNPSVVGTNVDITVGLWNLHQVGLATGTHQFVGFVGNLNRSANWLAYANNSSSSVTSVSTGVALTATNWYTLEFVYNAAAGSITFYIAGVLVATITTNFPAPTVALFPGFQILGNAGGSSTLLIDTYEFLAQPSTPLRFLYGPI